MEEKSKKEMLIKVQKEVRTPKRLYQKRKSLWYIIIKRLDVQNKERMVQTEGERPSDI